MTDEPIRLKRVYAPASPEDGRRVLVDRLWPRGLAKAAAEVDEWLREVAPSPELRRWWDHDPDRFADFADRYRSELRGSAAVDALADEAGRGTITLLFAARDERVNHAAVLAEVLRERLGAGARASEHGGDQRRVAEGERSAADQAGEHQEQQHPGGP